MAYIPQHLTIQQTKRLASASATGKMGRANCKHNNFNGISGNSSNIAYNMSNQQFAQGIK